jgi:hypothetical protein
MKFQTIGTAFAVLMLTLGATASHATVATPEGPSLAISLVGVGNTLAPQTEVLAYRGYGRPHRWYYPSIRYAPRHQPPPPPVRQGSSTQPQQQQDNPVKGFVQLHGGFFAPSMENTVGWWLAGGRFGASLGDHVQLGVQADWNHRSVHETTLTGTTTLPGGQPVERRIDLSEVSSDLVPALGFVQLSPFGGSFGPYFGAGAGYEALYLNATDFATGQDFSATYDGWGWQYYAGIAIPITRVARLNVEAFGNVAKLDREVDDPTFGRVREIVDAGGGGVRGGLSWVF